MAGCGIANMLGIAMGDMFNMRRIQTAFAGGVAAGDYHPDPALFASTTLVSGVRTTGSTIFQANEGATLWSIYLPPDGFATAPSIRVLDPTDNAVITGISAKTTSIGAGLYFPIHCPNGFLIQLTAAGSFGFSYSRLPALGAGSDS